MLRETGLPVGVGIGVTKTLAKLANRLAKKHPDFQAAGVCNLLELAPEQVAGYYTELAVGEVWGIGSRWRARLNKRGITTVADLLRAMASLVCPGQRPHRPGNRQANRTAAGRQGIQNAGRVIGQACAVDQPFLLVEQGHQAVV